MMGIAQEEWVFAIKVMEPHANPKNQREIDSCSGWRDIAKKNNSLMNYALRYFAKHPGEKEMGGTTIEQLVPIVLVLAMCLLLLLQNARIWTRSCYTSIYIRKRNHQLEKTMVVFDFIALCHVVVVIIFLWPWWRQNANDRWIGSLIISNVCSLRHSKEYI